MLFASVIGGTAGVPLLSGMGVEPIDTARTRDHEEWSQAGSVMGTIAYMAPEQARGEVDQLDERCDVFALGAILCKILTGKPAFHGKTPEEVAEQARKGDLKPCWKRLDASGSERTLTTLARRCLAPKAEDRPRDSGEVAVEIEAYLAAVAERARMSELEAAENKVRAEEAEARAVHERRARRLSLLLAATVIIALIAGTSGYIWIEKDRQQRVQKATETVNAKLAEARVEMSRAAVEPDPEKALTAWEMALRLGRDARDHAHTEELDPAAAERADSLMAELERGEAAARAAYARAKADRAMIQHLESINVKVSQDWNFKALDEGYSAAFAEYGIDLEELEAEEAAARIRESNISRELVGGMDDWANARRKMKRDANKLSYVSHLADPDPWRIELRKAYHQKNIGKIRELAQAKGLSEMTAYDALLLGRALRFVGEKAAAIAFLNQATLRFPDDFWINFDLGNILRNTQPSRSKEAIAFYRAALASSPRSVGAWSNLGLAFTLEGRKSEARHSFETALALNPDDAKTHWAHGVFLYLLEGDCDAAIQELNRSIELDPNDYYTYASLGYAWQIKGDFDKAIEAYNESIERNPDQVESWTNMSLILLERRDFETALDYAEKALKNDPTDAISLLHKGYALDALGDTDGAIESYESSLKYNPNSPETYNNLGLLFEQKEQRKEAIETYRKALAISPDHYFARKNLGSALCRVGEVDEGIKFLSKGVELYPEDSDMHFRLGEAFRKKGDLEAAIRELEKAIELDPQNEEARRSLEEVRSEQP